MKRLFLLITALLSFSASANDLQSELKRIDFEKVCNSPAQINVDEKIVHIECLGSSLYSKNTVLYGDYLKNYVPENALTPALLGLRSLSKLPVKVRTQELVNDGEKRIGYQTDYTYANESNTKIVGVMRIVHDVKGQVAYINYMIVL